MGATWGQRVTMLAAAALVLATTPADAARASGTITRDEFGFIEAGQPKRFIERLVDATGACSYQSADRLLLQYRQTFGPRGARWTAVTFDREGRRWIVSRKERSTTRTTFTSC